MKELLVQVRNLAQQFAPLIELGEKLEMLEGMQDSIEKMERALGGRQAELARVQEKIAEARQELETVRAGTNRERVAQREAMNRPADSLFNQGAAQ